MPSGQKGEAKKLAESGQFERILEGNLNLADWDALWPVLMGQFFPSKGAEIGQIHINFYHFFFALAVMHALMDNRK